MINRMAEPFIVRSEEQAPEGPATPQVSSPVPTPSIVVAVAAQVTSAELPCPGVVGVGHRQHMDSAMDVDFEKFVDKHEFVYGDTIDKRLVVTVASLLQVVSWSCEGLLV